MDVSRSNIHRPEALASENRCGIRPRRMVCLVMAIPKWNKTTKALLAMGETLKKLDRVVKVTYRECSGQWKQSY